MTGLGLLLNFKVGRPAAETPVRFVLPGQVENPVILFLQSVSNSKQMKAFIHTKYGPPEVLKPKVVPDPVPGDNEILIYGATGAIGSAALQITKAIGAEVTAVCDTSNIELIKSLGADEVIDYTKQDFTKIDKTFSVVFDAVGKSLFRACKSMLEEGGVYMLTDLGFTSQNPFLAVITPLFGGRKVHFSDSCN